MSPGGMMPTRAQVLAQLKLNRENIQRRLDVTKESIALLEAAGKAAHELDPNAETLKTPVGLMLNGIIGAQLSQLRAAMQEGERALADTNQLIGQEESLVKPAHLGRRQ